MNKDMTETNNSESNTNITVSRSRKIEEGTLMTGHNKVQYIVKRWSPNKTGKRLMKISSFCPGSIQHKIVDFARRYGSYTNDDCIKSDNLTTTMGRDTLHNACLKSTSQPAGFQYIALSTSVSRPSSSDTTLSDELTAPSNMIRALGVFTHTNGTNTSTIVKTFVNNSNNAISNIQRSATFNAVSDGDIGFSNQFTAVTLQPNDQLEVTWTITLG